jgi:hypothetical protein
MAGTHHMPHYRISDIYALKTGHQQLTGEASRGNHRGVRDALCQRSFR